jgi:hypothetical protein
MRAVMDIDASVRPPHTRVLTCTGIQFSYYATRLHVFMTRLPPVCCNGIRCGVFLSALRAQHPLNRRKRFTQLALENCKCMPPKAQTASL